MSRIQNILDKAERDGAALRTSRFASAAPPQTPAATVPITIELPDSAEEAAAVIAPGLPNTARSASGLGTAALAGMPHTSTETPVEEVTARLHPVLVAGLAPASLAAEQYRSLRTRLAHAEGSSALRTILVTSPQKGEGKSVTAANLALTMAQELQRRVVLLEADLRKPSLQQLFSLPAGPGLAEFLSGACTLSDAMKYLPDFNLTVMTAGAAPNNPAELLGSTAMRRLLDQLRTRFDRVILDTPPVLPLADVAVLAPVVDGALLVVRAGVTPKPAIENALRAFDASRLLGVVLNDSTMDTERYGASRRE
jgi:capsular exopolysaccharide synthesis family protein